MNPFFLKISDTMTLNLASVAYFQLLEIEAGRHGLWAYFPDAENSDDQTLFTATQIDEGTFEECRETLGRIENLLDRKMLFSDLRRL